MFFPNGGNFAPPGRQRAISGDILIVTFKGGGFLLTQWVETTDAVTHSTMHGIVPFLHDKDLSC